MAIVGEKLKSYVVNQINQRQKGLGDITKSDENLAYFNAKTAWVKLASGVEVTEKKLKSLSIGYSNAEAKALSGKNLAQSYVLFGGTSNLKNQTLIQKDGLSSNSSYDIDPIFGPVPMPGLKDVSIRCLNRGSLKKAKIKLKVETRTQLEIIDILYLRLGYTLFLEWGNSHYFDVSGKLHNSSPTLIEKKFFNSSFSKNSFLNILPEIEKERSNSNGNYDGFVGKVSNFDWSFNEDGSYDINLELISLGDVIESLKSNVVLDPITNEYVKVSTNGNTNSNLMGEGSINSNRTLNSIFSILYLWKVKNSQPIPDPNIYGSIINKALSIKSVSDPNVFSNTTAIDQHLYIGDVLDVPTSATATVGGTGEIGFNIKIGYVKPNHYAKLNQSSQYLQRSYDSSSYSEYKVFNSAKMFDSSGFNSNNYITANINSNGATILDNRILEGEYYVDIKMKIPISLFVLSGTGISKEEALIQLSNLPSFPSTVSQFQSNVKGGLLGLDPSGSVDNFVTWNDITAWIKYGKPVTGGSGKDINFSRDFQNDFSSFPNSSFNNLRSEFYQAKLSFYYLSYVKLNINNSGFAKINVKEYPLDDTLPTYSIGTGLAAVEYLLKDYSWSGLRPGDVAFNGRDIATDLLNIWPYNWLNNNGDPTPGSRPSGFTKVYPSTSRSLMSIFAYNRNGTGRGKQPTSIPNNEKGDSPLILAKVYLPTPPTGSSGSPSYLTVPNPLRNFEDGDVVRLYTTVDSLSIFSYYMRFGAVLNMLKNEVLSRIKVNSANDITTYNDNPNIVSINSENNPNNSSNFVSYMKYKPRSTSFDISKCIVNSSLELKGSGSSGDYSYTTFDNTSGLKEWKFSKNVTRASGSSFKNFTENYGNSMNVYLSFESIGDSLQSNTDEEGNISIFSFIKDMCNTINRSFAEVNNLEPVIDETTNVLSIVDSSLNQSSGIRDYEINPFGFIKNNSEGSFVRKVDLKTAITPAYATMVTVGATAGGYVKGVEATAFSKWNDGITDRFKTEFVPASKDAEVSNKNEGIQSSFENFDRIWLSEEDARLLPFGISTPISDLTNIPAIYNHSILSHDKVGSIQFNSTVIKENLQIATEYFRAYSAKAQDGGSIGFIPFNVGLKMDGISGIKIYNEIILNTRFLPRNYNSNLSFITTAVNHSLKDGDWETELKLTLIPTALTSDYDPPKRSSFVRTSVGTSSPPSPSPGSPPGPSGPCGTPPSTVGPPGVKYISPPTKGAPGDYVDVMKTVNSSNNKKLRKFNNCEYPIKLVTKPGDTSGTLYSKVDRNIGSRNEYEKNPAFSPFLKTLTYHKKYNGSSGTYKVYNVNKNWFPTIQKIIQHLDNKGMWNSTHIKTFSPGYVRRDITPPGGPLYGHISSHAYGMAMDINSGVYPLGSAGVAKWDTDFAAGVPTALVHDEIYRNFVLITPSGCQPVFWLKDGNDAHHFSVMIKT